MAHADTENFRRIMEGLNDTLAHSQGRGRAEIRTFTPPMTLDVKAIRAKTRLSQTRFARRYGFSPGAVRDWEQGRKQPEAAARVLLTVIDREPEAVERALAGG